MTFAWPIALAALALVPLLAAAWVLLDGRRRESAERFGNRALLPGLVAARPGLRRHLPPLLAVVAFAVLVVGLARPHATVTKTRDEATVVLTIDTSRSMAANDVRPSRLEAARAAGRAFLDKVPENYRVGIVSFSSRANVVLPPTTDREAARLALAQLRLGTGTAIGEAIARSVSLVAPEGQRVAGAGDRPPAAVVLLSDGAQTAGGAHPLSAARRARAFAVPVSTVALGTRDAVVEVPLPGGLKERVQVPPDPPSLRRIAQATGGRFFDAPDATKLEEVYRELGTRLAKHEQREELTSLFAGAGAIVLLLSGALSTAWFRRAL